MKNCLDLLALVRQLDALDRPAGILDKFVVTGALSFLPLDALRIAVFVDRPHGVGIKACGDVVVHARLREIAGRFGGAPLLLTARGGAGELARDIDEFLNAPADFLEIRLYARSAIADDFPRAALIPVDAASLNDLVQDPALLAPAANFTFGFDSHGLSCGSNVQKVQRWVKSRILKSRYFVLTKRSSMNFRKSTFLSCGVESSRLWRTASRPWTAG